MSKVKGATHSAWSHHDTMIVNLRDWVRREVNVLRNDMSKEVPSLADDPNVLKILKSVEDMNDQLFHLIRSVVDRAEAEAAKQKKAAKVAQREVDETIAE